jgi:spermidine synthase
MEDSEGPRVVDRVATDRGELVLRQVGDHFEIISNGVFLMDDRNGESERLLVSAGLAQTPNPRSVLIGGLGMGFSAEEALDDPRVEIVTVVEVEPAVIGWHRGPLAGHIRSDPRLRVVGADIVSWLATTDERYDLIALDVDNGPDWTVTETNGALYAPAGVDRIRSRLTTGGAATWWSAASSAQFEAALRRAFARVQVLPVAVARGEPDVVYLAAD